VFAVPTDAQSRRREPTGRFVLGDNMRGGRFGTADIDFSADARDDLLDEVPDSRDC